MTNEQIFIQQIKKNLQKLTEVTSADLTLQVDKYRSAPLVDLKIYFELSESVIDWNLVEERLREQIAVKHEQGFGIIDDNQFYDLSFKTPTSSFKNASSSSLVQGVVKSPRTTFLPSQSYIHGRLSGSGCVSNSCFNLLFSILSMHRMQLHRTLLV